MGYGPAPWVFRGSALYQLQLVPTEEARKHIPPNFKIVSLFGHTLGGFYLARYTDSPVGAFDELVAMAGLVWNPPTSCAWAARVYVSNREARDHGRRCVGLPSAVATFEAEAPGTPPAAADDQAPAPAPRALPRAAFARRGRRGVDGATPRLPPAAAPKPPPVSWWEATAPTAANTPTPLGASLLSIHSEDAAAGPATSPACTLALPPAPRPGTWAGPRLTLALPSFSGGTPACPALLKYACTLATRVRPLPPARLVVVEEGDAAAATAATSPLRRLLGGRHLLALQFGDMTMTVQEPTKVVVESEKARGGGARRRAALLA